ncbi:nucleotide modification associated domain-containing protein [Carnobacterium jeotgali]|uniref:nucleotide modification associated domain-containing protein n=1 Tax=Carnobacterium jeotgali TaxID=545534 RepID=UPI00388F7516
MNTIIVDNLMAWVKNEEDFAGNWRDDLPVIAVSELEQFIKDQPQPTKTALVPSSKSYLHSRITKELNAIYVAKNSDYGDAFGETYKKLGIISAVTRITDKVNRLQSLAVKSEEERMVKDESILDTLLDLTNYSLMTLIEMGYEPPND